MNEIDDIFKDAAQAEQATFKPEYWEQYAEQFSGEKKKRKGVFGFFLGELLFVSCIVLLAYNNSFVSSDSELAINTSQIDTESNTDVLNQNTTNNFDVSNNSDSDNGIETNQLAKVNDNNSFVSNPVIFSNANLDLKEKTNLDSPNSIKTNTKTVGANLVSTSSINSTPLSQNSLANNSSASSNVNYINSSNTNSQLVVKNEKLKEENDQNSVKGEGIEIEKSQIEKDSNQSIASIDKGLSIPESQDSNVNSVAKPEKKSSVITTSKLKKIQFNFQIGGIAYNDFNLNQNVRDIKTGIFAGIEVEYLLKPNLIVSIGVNGYTRNSDGLFIDFDYLDEGFGEVNSKKTYSYTDLYFIEVPVNLNYVINSRHKIGAGPTFTRLLTTKVNVNETVKDVKNNLNNTVSNDQYLYHYNTFGLNNIGINLNYQYMFNRVGVSLGYTQGLNEFLDKKTFGSSRFNSLNKFNLSIKYKL